MEVKAPVFTFDAQAHKYYLDNIEIPGVTTVLKTVGLIENYYGFGDAQFRGLHVHFACELLDLNDLDWRTVYPAWQGYVKSYMGFKEETGFIPELIEFQTYHPVYRFGGTMDRRGRLPNLLKNPEQRAELDLKTGTTEDWHKYQTGGYKILGRNEWMNDRRGCLYLQEDGSPAKLAWHDDDADLRVFLAALTVTHAKWSKRK